MPCSPTSIGSDNYLIVTSTTRPTGADLRTGLVIYELDTDRMWRWNGAAWVFFANGTAASRPGVQLSDAAQSIPNNAGTIITWGTEVLDPDGWTSGGSGSITVPTGWDGKWLVTFTVVWAAPSGTATAVAILIAGTGVAGTGGPSAFQDNTATAALSLAAGQVLTFACLQNSGGAVNASSTLDISWLGR